MHKEISLCLSGGAARGAYELGIVSVLQEHNITIKAISGTSIGALIGAAFACGKKASFVFEVMRSKEFRSVFSFKPFKGALFQLNQHATILDSIIDKESFEALEIPLCVVACDVVDAKPLYFQSGDDLRMAVLASCSIPPLFHPVTYKDRVLMDGGVVDNFPVEWLQQYDYPIVGINLHPKKHHIPKSFYGWLRNNVYIAWQAPNQAKQELCDIYLCNPKLLECKVFSFGDIDKAYHLGREQMQKMIQEGSF